MNVRLTSISVVLLLLPAIVPLVAQPYQAEIEVYGRDRDRAPYRVGADVRFSFTPLQRDAARMTDASLRYASRSRVRYHFDYGSEDFSVREEDIVRAVHRLEVVVEMSRSVSLGIIGQYDTLKYGGVGRLQYAKKKIAGVLAELRMGKGFRMSAAMGVGRSEMHSPYRYRENNKRDVLFVQHELEFLRDRSAFSQVITVEIAEEGMYHDGWILLDISNAVELSLNPWLSVIPRVAVRDWLRYSGISENEFACGLRWYPYGTLSAEIAPMYLIHKRGCCRDAEQSLAIEGRVRLRL